MSATDELRRMLDERGVEYDVKDLSNIKFFHDTRWNANGVRWCYTEFVGATTCLTMCNEWKDCTPEQAISATLGSERERRLELLVNQLWYLVNHRSGYGYAAALEAIEELGIEVDE